jgi:hypothetical protein
MLRNKKINEDKTYECLVVLNPKITKCRSR